MTGEKLAVINTLKVCRYWCDENGIWRRTWV
jgi:hypothetical protein